MLGTWYDRVVRIAAHNSERYGVMTQCIPAFCPNGVQLHCSITLLLIVGSSLESGEVPVVEITSASLIMTLVLGKLVYNRVRTDR